MKWIALALAGGLLCAGCSGAPKEQAARRPLTEARRDSLLARSPLQGASAVGRALVMADSAEARKARFDAMTR